MDQDNNRTFLKIAIVLGAIIMLSLMCMAIYALVILPAQQATRAQTPTLSVPEAIDTRVALAVEQTLSVMRLTQPYPLAATPQPSSTPFVVIIEHLPTSDISASDPTSEIPTPGISVSGYAYINFLSEIDKQFETAIKANIAFNKPTQMKRDETTNVELILSPSWSEADLATRIVKRGGFVTSTAEPGKLVAPDGQTVTVETSEVEITPRMKAVLISVDPDAFILEKVHDSAEQIISSVDPTIWRWAVTAKKEGTQTLEMVIYRLIKYEGKEYWHEVQTYKTNIVVEVTPLQKIETWDWKWIASALLIPLVVAAWGWLRNKKKKAGKDKPVQAAKKRKNHE